MPIFNPLLAGAHFCPFSKAAMFSTHQYRSCVLAVCSSTQDPRIGIIMSQSSIKKIRKILQTGHRDSKLGPGLPHHMCLICYTPETSWKQMLCTFNSILGSDLLTARECKAHTRTTSCALYFSTNSD
jgi:hypothetical protein